MNVCHCVQAASIDDNYIDAHICAGESYMLQENWDEAVRDCDAMR